MRLTSRWLSALFLINAACANDPTTTSARRLQISLEPEAATVAQGDSSALVAVVSANFELATDPAVFVAGAPAGVSARVGQIERGIQLASLQVMISVSPAAVPGTYELQVRATNAARETPIAAFVLTIVQRPDCTPAAPCLQWARSAIASSQYTSDQWGARQATGAPNVGGCSDHPNAWASAEPNTQEWLEVRFGEAMIASRIDIYENYGASSIVSVEVKDEADNYHIVYTGAPGRLTCPSERRIPLTDMTYKVKAVRLNFDQKTLNDWNEIDAVGLVGYRAN